MFKFIVGSICAWAIISLAVTVYGLAVAYRPIPKYLLSEYSIIISYVTQLLSFLPFVVLGAFAAKFFFPLRSVRWSFLCFLSASIAGFWSFAFESPEVLGAAFRLALELDVVFVVGVPIVVYLLERRHANKLLKPSP